MFRWATTAKIDDTLVPIIYPRSLLYFLSRGVVEREADGKSARDLPLVGMQRFHIVEVDRDRFAGLPGIGKVRDFISEDPRRVVWTVTATDASAGLRGDTVTHAGFDDTGAARPHGSDGQRQAPDHPWVGVM